MGFVFFFWIKLNKSCWTKTEETKLSQNRRNQQTTCEKQKKKNWFEFRLTLIGGKLLDWQQKLLSESRNWADIQLHSNILQ